MTVSVKKKRRLCASFFKGEEYVISDNSQGNELFGELTYVRTILHR